MEGLAGVCNGILRNLVRQKNEIKYPDMETEPVKAVSYTHLCFRKEVGAHGIEERGVYRIHQFEKQEMIVVCKPEDSMSWYNRLWQNTVDYLSLIHISMIWAI